MNEFQVGMDFGKLVARVEAMDTLLRGHLSKCPSEGGEAEGMEEGVDPLRPLKRMMRELESGSGLDLSIEGYVLQLPPNKRVRFVCDFNAGYETMVTCRSSQDGSVIARNPEWGWDGAVSEAVVEPVQVARILSFEGWHKQCYRRCSRYPWLHSYVRLVSESATRVELSWDDSRPQGRPVRNCGVVITIE